MDYDILKENCIFNLEAKDSRTVITRLVELLKNSGIITDEKEILKSVLDREKVRGTGLAKGIACPHAKINGLKGVQVAIARLKTPVDFQATDRIPARHVFLILTDSSYELSVHLKTLSNIVKFYQSPGMIHMLDDAEDLDEYFEILQSYHEK